MPFFGGLRRQRIWTFWRRVLHTCHHRTQVQTWLRLAGHEPVPAIYGPSGDVKWAEADPTYSVEAAKRGAPPFDMLIMSEASRLGRDMTRNAAYVVSIIEAGVRIWYYLTDEEERALLFDLLAARVAMALAISAWRSREHPENRAYIAAETLVKQWATQPLGADAFKAEVKIESQLLTIELRKA